MRVVNRRQYAGLGQRTCERGTALLAFVVVRLIPFLADPWVPALPPPADVECTVVDGGTMGSRQGPAGWLAASQQQQAGPAFCQHGIRHAGPPLSACSREMPTRPLRVPLPQAAPEHPGQKRQPSRHHRQGLGRYTLWHRGACRPMRPAVCSLCQALMTCKGTGYIQLAAECVYWWPKQAPHAHPFTRGPLPASAGGRGLLRAELCAGRRRHLRAEGVPGAAG